MAKKNNNLIVLISIIAIVVIVGIVLLVLNYVKTQPVSAEEKAISGDLTGQVLKAAIQRRDVLPRRVERCTNALNDQYFGELGGYYTISSGKCKQTSGSGGGTISYVGNSNTCTCESICKNRGFSRCNKAYDESSGLVECNKKISNYYSDKKAQCYCCKWV